VSKTLSIASVTVAFNGAKSLPRQLDALQRQTRALDEIVVVDNASTDSTVDLLVSKYPEITVLKLPENAGVGGGFAAGLHYAAITKKYDWVWLFDQDSVPTADGLELLLGGLEKLAGYVESTAILAPVCLHSQTGMVYPGLTWKSGWRYTDLATVCAPFVFVDSAISSGTLLKREPAVRVGLPREDFFMDFVDHEYCFRLRQAGYVIAIVTACRLDHEIGSARRIDFLGLSKKWADHSPLREYYMARNEVFTIWKYHPDWRSKLSTVSRLLNHVFEVFLFGCRKFACFQMMVRGLLDGLAGRLGVRDFDTGELKQLPKLETTPQYGRTL